MTANKTTAAKTNAGNFFEDFRIGQVFEHATRCAALDVPDRLRIASQAVPQIDTAIVPK